MEKHHHLCDTSQSSLGEDKERFLMYQKIFSNDNLLHEFQFSALVKEFSKSKTNEAKMKVSLKYYHLLGKDNYIEQCFRQVKDKTNFKDKETSERLRTQGNTEYRKGEDKKALELYTKSIAYAPQDSGELSLAYANRSAVLRSMKKCRECLVDIERALSHGYPRDKSYKLMLREMQCHRDLENNEEMDASFEKAASLLQSMPGLTEEERAALQKHLEEEKKAPPKEVCTEQVIFPEQVPELSYGASSEVVGASSAVRIEYNVQQGRHLVAARDINIGDVLLIGENIAGALVDQHKYDHCSHCHKPCYNLLPCHNCVWVLFCSEKCQTEANQKYHVSECSPFSRFCHSTGREPFMTFHDRVIRLLSMIGIDNLRAYLKYARTNTKKPMTNEAKRTKGFNSHGVFDPSNVDTVFNLISMIDHRDQNEVLRHSLFSLQIPRCFGISMNDPDFFAMAGLCLQLKDTAHLASITNSYCDFRFYPVQVPAPADCFNPLNSLINHSCFSNLTSVLYGHTYVTLAKWPISKGNILTESYNDYDVKVPKHERQVVTKDGFLFVCKCDACENDWRFHDCISDPMDRNSATQMYLFTERVIVKWHKIHPASCLTPIFKPFLKSRHDLLTKLWKKGEFLDPICEELQYQLRVYDRLQGNRLIVPIKNAPKQYYQPELLTELNDLLLEEVKRQVQMLQLKRITNQ